MQVKTKTIEPLRPDERGEAYPLEVRSTGYILVVHRKAGTVSGSHYHKGISKSKSPEMLYIVDGEARLVTQDMGSRDAESRIVAENTLIEIPADIYHELHALTDLTFLELNERREDFREDTFYPGK